MHPFVQGLLMLFSAAFVALAVLVVTKSPIIANMYLKYVAEGGESIEAQLAACTLKVQEMQRTAGTLLAENTAQTDANKQLLEYQNQARACQEAQAKLEERLQAQQVQIVAIAAALGEAGAATSLADVQAGVAKAQQLLSGLQSTNTSLLEENRLLREELEKQRTTNAALQQQLDEASKKIIELGQQVEASNDSVQIKCAALEQENEQRRLAIEAYVVKVAELEAQNKSLTEAQAEMQTASGAIATQIATSKLTINDIESLIAALNAQRTQLTGSTEWVGTVIDKAGSLASGNTANGSMALIKSDGSAVTASAETPIKAVGPGEVLKVISVHGPLYNNPYATPQKSPASLPFAAMRVANGDFLFYATLKSVERLAPSRGSVAAGAFVTTSRGLSPLRRIGHIGVANNREEHLDGGKDLRVATFSNSASASSFEGRSPSDWAPTPLGVLASMSQFSEFRAGDKWEGLTFAIRRCGNKVHGMILPPGKAPSRDHSAWVGVEDRRGLTDPSHIGPKSFRWDDYVLFESVETLYVGLVGMVNWDRDQPMVATEWTNVEFHDLAGCASV